MKRLLLFFAAITLFVSCSNESGDDFTPNAELLIGKWRSGTEYYRYDTGGNGLTWDTKESTEEQAQSFTWSLNGSKLSLLHKLQMGGTVPKDYTVKSLTSTTLMLMDTFNKSTTFTKQ